jgi:predicted small secreted protein
MKNRHAICIDDLRSLSNFTEETLMKTLSIVLLGLFTTLTLSACNTVEGAGKDVKATGAAVEKAAEESKPK